MTEKSLSANDIRQTKEWVETNAELMIIGRTLKRLLVQKGIISNEEFLEAYQIEAEFVRAKAKEFIGSLQSYNLT